MNEYTQYCTYALYDVLAKLFVVSLIFEKKILCMFIYMYVG